MVDAYNVPPRLNALGETAKRAITILRPGVRPGVRAGVRAGVFAATEVACDPVGVVGAAAAPASPYIRATPLRA